MLSSSSTLSPRGKLYVACVVAAGAAAILHSLAELYRSPLPYGWIILVLLTLFSGTFSIKVPSIPAYISVSEMFIFTAVLLFGTAPGTLIVALDGLIISIAKKNRRLDRVLFNVAEPAISIWIAAGVFFLLSGVAPLHQNPIADVGPLVLPLVLLTVAYFLLNSWLTALAVWLETGTSPVRLWRQHFLWLSLNYFGGASVALLIARNASTVDWSVLSLIVPLLVISYLTYKTALGRVQDAHAHVAQLNSLYLSTIETFAMWIDAKDQVTHGHIRRVQTYAVRLARELGLRDENLLRAVEAAALLHDMGKLAVPEHILNKPGKLTAGEFERMKLHASVGAEILSSIDFPYPVVPIVRHHHENWDGTGYPDGLAGTDIPIGARVLAVVDCFDALTSDRPYRPKLTDETAISILLERRGAMYDPLVVDAFMRVHEAITSTMTSEQLSDHGPSDSCRPFYEQPEFAPRDLADNGEGVLALHQLAKSLAGHAGLQDTADIIGRHLAQLVPSSLCVLYEYRPETDELVAIHASGTGASDVKGSRLHLGASVSGWVAANRVVALDSDARLDLKDSRHTSLAGLRRAHSFPLLSGQALAGVLTLYSESDEGLTEAARRTIDLLAPQFGRALAQAAQYDKEQRACLKDGVTGLPRLETLIDLVPSTESRSGVLRSLVVVFLDIEDFETLNTTYGPGTGDTVLQHVTAVLRGCLRGGDLLLRYRRHEFVILLTAVDITSAEAVATRLVEGVSSCSHRLNDKRTVPIRLISGHAIAPRDGESLDAIVDVARRRAFALGTTIRVVTGT